MLHILIAHNGSARKSRRQSINASAGNSGWLWLIRIRSGTCAHAINTAASCLDSCLYCCLDNCLESCPDSCLHICLDSCLYSCLDSCIDRCLDSCLDNCLHSCLDSCIDSCLDTFNVAISSYSIIISCLTR